MRASIPALIVLCLMCGRYLSETLLERRMRLPALLLAALLLVGCITPMVEFARGVYKVKTAGTIFLAADPFKTVLHPDADTHNFICEDVESAAFYRYFAKPQ